MGGDSPNTAAKQFARYVLTSFDPLLCHLDHFDHPIWDGQTIGIRANSDGEPLLAIKHETIEALMEEFAGEDADVQGETLLRLARHAIDDKEAPWPATEDRFIGFFDVMGFSALIRNASDDHSHLYSVMRGLHDAARRAETLLAKGAQHTQVVSRSAAPSRKLKAVQFSDSVLVATEDASPSADTAIAGGLANKSSHDQ